MELIFDKRGNLKHDNIIEITIDSFREIFVEAHKESLNREIHFQNYQNYTKALASLTEYSFYQWIDGSFISNKKDPNDIDLITILDYRDYERNKLILEKDFASFSGRRNYKVDAYIVSNYPKDHKKYIFTQSDLLYWRNLFGKTRVDRKKKQYKKGIVQLNHT